MDPGGKRHTAFGSGEGRSGVNKDNIRILLASKSPRRKELLNRLLPDFEIVPAECEEIMTKTDPGDIVEELSLTKARWVFDKEKGPDSDLLVIGADTIVTFEGKILGKPKDEADAFNMLRMLSGKDHQVYTGVTLIRYERAGEETCKTKTFHECTSVRFQELTDEEILNYIRTKDPMDKAGAYGIQGYASRFIPYIEGDYFNVVGLPVAALYRELKDLL